MKRIFSLLQKVLNNDKQNTVVSPFLVKLLLAILAEMAGPGSAAHREIVSVLPSIDTETDLLELYASPFVSLLVSLNILYSSAICFDSILKYFKPCSILNNLCCRKRVQTMN